MTKKSSKNTKFITHFRVISALSILIFSIFIDIDLNSIPILRSIILSQNNQQLKYWGICLDKWNKNGNLRSMNRVFEKLNFKFVDKSESFDIVWSIEGPSVSPYDKVKIFKKHQKINHFPGNTVLVTKSYMNFYNSHLPFILPLFRLPYDKNSLKNYIENHPEKKFVRKNQFNRGIEIIPAMDMNDKDPDEFFQVFLDNPLLINGHAFDLGIFVLITSLNPLRIYKFNHEILLRFCPRKYFPFNDSDVDKYVVQDGHKSVYEMKGFGDEYKKYSGTFKELFEGHLRGRNFDVGKLWNDIDDAIVGVIKTSETMMLDTIKFQQRSVHNFFELVRFDFMIDENLNVFIMEVNMSPNMTPAEDRFEENSKIYEPMIFSMIQMIGGGSYHEFMSRFTNDTTMTTTKNLIPSAENCIIHNCINNCHNQNCQLCLPCMNSETIFNLREAYREWKYQSEFKRIFPSQREWTNEGKFKTLSEKNQLMTKWFKEMCKKNEKFC